ncbi:MAG: Hpt domain-containing protein, partial [Isosphaeraceae bacterium]
MSEDLSGFSLMDLFRMEAESHTSTLSTGLVALENAEGPAAPETIEPLMRAAHSLKGAARIVGLDAAVRVAHAMEDGFVAAQKGQLVLRPGHVDVLLRGVDFLVQVAQVDEADLPAWQADHAAEVDALVAALEAVKEDRVSSSASTPAPSAPPEIQPAEPPPEPSSPAPPAAVEPEPIAREIAAPTAP